MSNDEVTGGDVKRRTTYTPPPEGAQFPERLGELTDDDVARAKKASEAASLAQESAPPETSPARPTDSPAAPVDAATATNQPPVSVVQSSDVSEPSVAPGAQQEPVQHSSSTDQVVPEAVPGPVVSEPVIPPPPVAAPVAHPGDVSEPAVSPGAEQEPAQPSSSPDQVVPEAVPGPVVSEPVIPPPPTRTSLDDQQIMAQFYDRESPSTETLMSALEAQLDLRAQEDALFDQWSSQIRTLLPGEEAEFLISQSRRRFDGLPPLPEPPPRPPAPTLQEPPAPTPEEPPSSTPQEGGELQETPGEPEGEVVVGDPLLAGLVADTAEIPVADTAPSEVTPDTSEPVPPSVFDAVLSDPDATSPATAAWPLVTPDSEGEAEGSAGAEDSPPAEATIDGAESTPAPEGESVADQSAEGPIDSDHVAPPALTESGISVGTETLTIREAVATKEIPAEPFSAITVEKERWFSFDRAGLEPSPELNRTTRVLTLFWTWWSVTVPLGGVLVGAWLAHQDSSFVQALLAAGIGVLVGALPLIIGTRQGVKTGLPALIVSRQVFGLWGNILPAAIAVLIRIAVGAFFLWSGVWVATEVYGEANLWTGDPRALGVIVATVGVLIVGALVIAGRHWVSLVMGVSGGLSLVAAVVLVVVMWELPTASALQGTAIDGAGLVSGASFVAAVLFVLWSQTGSDIARFVAPGRAAPASAVVGVAAIIPPLILMSWGALVGASSGGVGEGFVDSPLGTLLGLVPDWYPIPALMLLALPLLGLSALALHSASYSVMSLGFAIPRYGSAAVVSVSAAGAVFVVLLTLGDPGAFLPGAVVFLGVPAAAWVGSLLGDVVTRRAHPDAQVLLAKRGSYPNVRVAPLLGFVAAIGVGWGLVAIEVPGLGWTGYITNLLASAGFVDLTAWQPGVAISLAVSFVVACFAGIRGGALDGSGRGKS